MQHLRYILPISCLLILFGCREAFDVESIEFVDALVVESTITNEMKHQEVTLTRSYVLEGEEPTIENNATVWIEDDHDNQYSFSQNTDGVYISDIEFQAVPNTSYTLYITTQDGKQYHSNQVLLTPASNITNLYAELVTLDNGNQGIQVLLDSDNTNDEAQYFRYEYIETYKIIPPKFYNTDLTITNLIQNANGLVYDRILTVREQEEGVCYSTVLSQGIIQTTTTDLESNAISKFPVRFIPKDNGIIRERYSILVKQYVQNIEAYTYYKTIDELGIVGSILSQTQPGYVVGNMVSSNNETEKVIGYFEASSVSYDRIYFNYLDFDIDKPPYLYECTTKVLDYNDNSPHDGDENERNLLYQFITVNNFKLSAAPESSTIYEISNAECSDCTSVSSNIRPDFWED